MSFFVVEFCCIIIGEVIVALWYNKIIIYLKKRRRGICCRIKLFTALTDLNHLRKCQVNHILSKLFKMPSFTIKQRMRIYFQDHVEQGKRVRLKYSPKL